MSKKLKKEIISLSVLLAAYLTAYLTFVWISCPSYARIASYGVLYALSGWRIVVNAVKKIARGQLLDEDFLMTVASIGAFAIGEYAEAVAVILFFRFGDWFERYAVGKSRSSITALMQIKPETACILRDGEEVTVFPEEVEVGELLIVRAGEKISVDGIVEDGAAALDTMALTGESIPRDVAKGDSVLSGCISLNGVLKIRATANYEGSTVAKILDMVENATSRKAKTEKFITKFAQIYTPSVVVTAILLAMIPSLITQDWLTWTFKALTLLVVSCPCALVISVPLSFFGGIGAASAQGILIKGSNIFAPLAKSNVFVMDKTGTITQGEFVVTDVYPPQKRVEILACAAVCENGSRHPIARSILKLCEQTDVDGYLIEELAGKGVQARKDDEFLLCGNAKLMSDFGVQISSPDGEETVVYCAKNGVYLGKITVEDCVKLDAKQAIAQLNEVGKTVMLTGDSERTSSKVAQAVGVSAYHAGLLPNEKVERMEQIMAQSAQTVVFVGDGINDAPALTRADVGIAMGNKGSNVAVESADIVLMYDKVEDVAKARKIARKTIKIVWENIVFALAVKLAIMIYTAVFSANMWLAVFADVGVSLIAILNAMRCGRIR